VFYDLTPEFQAAEKVGQSIYTPWFATGMRENVPFDVFSTRGSHSCSVDVTITRLICESYLAENGLAQVDRLGMASSVEVRQPLVDHRLVEVVTGLRKHHSDVDLPPKRWLHDAVRDIVPHFVLERSKRCFTPPWRQWAHATAERYSEQLENGYLVESGVLRPEAARVLARRLHVSPLGVPWCIADFALSLELWCRAMAKAAARGGESAALRAAALLPSFENITHAL
jgi:asparagine synthase (glutamine-hydrolysing)